MATLPKRFIPCNATELRDDELKAVVYLYEKIGEPLALAYLGKRRKPIFNIFFGTKASREIYVKNWLTELRQKHEDKALNKVCLKR